MLILKVSDRSDPHLLMQIIWKVSHIQCLHPVPLLSQVVVYELTNIIKVGKHDFEGKSSFSRAGSPPPQ